MTTEPEFYTVKQAAARLGVSRGLIYKMFGLGTLRGYKVGPNRFAKVLIRREDLMAALLPRGESDGVATDG